VPSPAVLVALLMADVGRLGGTKSRSFGPQIDILGPGADDVDGTLIFNVFFQIGVPLNKFTVPARCLR
jgi:hypothetical protein